jgi:hypothetical protein
MDDDYEPDERDLLNAPPTPAAHELAEALRDAVLALDNTVRADWSSPDTSRAHALLDRFYRPEGW